jgi:uncharacterized protein YbgA (DUF1722 family)/uncharacterized protein YbbK (DUF523 family)
MRSSPWPEVRIGISSCLLGAEVRFDGGHKRDSFLVETFGKFVEWVPVCPEVEAGFGTPRESMRLVRSTQASGNAETPGEPVRLVTIKSGVDLTKPLERYTARRVDQLAGERLSGYVLKKDSPSCGMARVKIYGDKGPPARVGRGVFASGLIHRFPDLPIEEEGRLSDPGLRENFVERVFAYRRLRDLFDGRWRAADLVAFHTAHKLVLMAHAPVAYRELGRLVAQVKRVPAAAMRDRYQSGFMGALAVLATRRTHTNVLQHMAGYFREIVDKDSRTELLETIASYRKGLVPLIVPITLIRHHVRHGGVGYLAGQIYLEPHPAELMLRNHV